MRRSLTRILICLALGAVTTVGVAWSSVWWAPLPATDTWSNENHLVRSVSAGSSGGPFYDFLRVGRQDRVGALRLWSSWYAPGVIGGSFVSDPTKTPDSICPAWARLVLPSIDFIDYAGWDGHTRTEEARGWPMLALWSGFVECELWGRRVNEPRIIERHAAHEWAIPLPPRTDLIQISADGVATMPAVTASRQLPLGPMWPGFLINTIFYGALWFGSFFGFGAGRRTLRKKRGRCPMCAYDLRGGAMGPAGSRTSPAGCPECGWNRAEDEA